MNSCPKCQGVMKKAGKYYRCPNCELYCQKCGTRVNILTKICPECKNKVKLSEKAVKKFQNLGFVGMLLFGGLTYLFYHWKNILMAEESILAAFAELGFYIFLVIAVCSIILFLGSLQKKE